MSSQNDTAESTGGNPGARFTRQLSQPFLDLLTGPLKFLTEVATWHPTDPYAFDLQIREGDKLTVYHGTTKLLNIQRKRNGELLLYAHERYAKASNASDVLRTWQISDLSNSGTPIKEYLVSATSLAPGSSYRKHKEGYWQNRLSLAFGQGWNPEMDWLIIDREAVIGYKSGSIKSSIFEPIRQKYQAIKDEFRRENPKKWGELKTKAKRKGLGDELDFLAIGPTGELYTIELKHGSSTNGVYWGGLQVGVYLELFNTLLPTISEDIKTLVRQKVALGLLPTTALSRLPNGSFRKTLPILAVADPKDRSNCWTMLPEVMARCPSLPLTVVEFRNYNDPAPVIRTLGS